MQNIIYTFFLMLIVQTVYSQSIVEIRFNSLKSGKVNVINTKTSKSETLIIKEGLLTFEDKVDDPTLFSFIVEGYNDARPLNLILSHEKTEVEFSSFIKVIESEVIKKIYPNQPAFIKDPNCNRAFYEFHSEWMNFYDTIRKLSTSDSKELLEKRKQAYHSFVAQCKTIVRNNRDKFVSAIIIDFLLNNGLLQLETIQSFYDYLAPSVKESFFGLKIGEYAGKAGRLQPGQSAPEFELTDLDNQKYQLSNFQGKQVLLHFWSSSCAPCIKEAPELIRLAKENNNSLVTINISLDVDKVKWEKGIVRAGMGEIINVCDFKAFNSKVIQDYAINVVPSYYLIDEKGKIILKGSLNQVSEEIKKRVP